MSGGRDGSRERLATLLRERAGAGTTVLSAQQRQLWFLDQMYPEATAYHVPLGYDLTGPLDVRALRTALTGVVGRHEVLRAVFDLTTTEVRQRFPAGDQVDLPVTDVSAEPDPAAAAAAFGDRRAAVPFDLDTGPVLRADLVRLGHERHRLLVCVHHIAFDGWSATVFGAGLAAGYRMARHGRGRPGIGKGSTAPVGYGQFCRWQHKRLTGDRLDRLQGFWATALHGVEDLAPLPTDHPRSADLSFAGAHFTRRVPAGLAEAVEERARELRTTPFVMLLSAYAMVLIGQTGDDSIAVGTPVANRAQPRFHGTVGLVATTLVLRLESRPGLRMDEVVRIAHERTVAALGHQEMPLELLASALRTRRDETRNPFFDAAFSFRDDDAEGWDLPGCRVEVAHPDAGGAKFDLTLSLSRDRGGLRARWEYRRALYRAETVDRLADQFDQVLRRLVENPQAPVGRLPAVIGGTGA